MPKTIEITVPFKGISKGQRRISMEASGYQGTSCKSATEAFERALGTVVESTAKPELYETEQGVEREHNR